MRQIIKMFSRIVADYDISLWEIEPTSHRFKANIRFADDSVLMVKDYLFPTGRKYAYSS